MVKYQVGMAEKPKENDPTFDDVETAEKHALQESANEAVYAVWEIDEATGEASCVVALAYFYELYLP
jgi:hypothetical protein